MVVALSGLGMQKNDQVCSLVYNDLCSARTGKADVHGITGDNRSQYNGIRNGLYPFVGN